MKRTLKGKNKEIFAKKITYNPITKKFGPEDDSSNIETELSDPEDNITVNDSGQSDESNSNSTYPAKRPKGVKSWVWHYIQKGNHGEKNKCLVKKNDIICGRLFKTKTSTDNLANHLRTEHQINEKTAQLPKLADISTGKVSIQTTIPVSFDTVRPYDDGTQNDIDKDLVDWIVDDLQPFTTIVNEKFRHLISHLNKRYALPSISKLKGLIFNNVQEKQQLLAQLLHDSMISTNFTTDEWTAYHRPYIGITIHWISANFELHQALLTIEEIPYPHTGWNIAQKLAKTFDNWGLNNRIFVGVSDNAANVTKAMSDLAEFEYEIKHIRCAAHTIQLSVKKGLEVIKEFLSQVSKLNNFLVNKDKHRESLRKMQEICHSKTILEPLSFDDNELIDQNQSFNHIVEPIRDVITRWNSTFKVLCRLNELKAAIKLLITTLKSESVKDYHDDGILLESLFLNDDQWNIVDELIILLKNFAAATEIFGGSNYPTLSLTYPIISNLFQHLTLTKRKVKSSEVINVCDEIYLSMEEKWTDPGVTGLIASFLDLRFKDLTFVTTSQRREVHTHFKNLISKNQQNQQPENFLESSSSSTSKSSALLLLFGNTQIVKPTNKSELDKYLELPAVSIFENYDPLEWWKVNQNLYPTLAHQARIYLAIPSTSVPCERLFSVAGNTITDRRNRLVPSTVYNLLFLKENSHLTNNNI